jgi:hypothetical protein
MLLQPLFQGLLSGLKGCACFDRGLWISQHFFFVCPPTLPA